MAVARPRPKRSRPRFAAPAAGLETVTSDLAVADGPHKLAAQVRRYHWRPAGHSRSQRGRVEIGQHRGHDGRGFRPPFRCQCTRVNAVAPGVVDTEMSNFTKTDAGRQYALNMQAVQRLAQPEDIGLVVAFPASDDARWITGDTVRADGGSKL